MHPDPDFNAIDFSLVSPSDAADWIAVLPLGAHEQHGPHLPFETDTIIAQGIANSLKEKIASTLPVTFLPSDPIGYSIEHMDYGGSKTRTYSEAIERWTKVGEGLSKRGIRKLLLLNAHGGNSPLMTIVATELRVRFDMLCVTTSWTRFIAPGDIVSVEEKAFGIHGGDIETAVMLALAPQTVNMEKAEDFGSFQKAMAEEFSHLRAYGPHAFGWKIQDLNPKGVTGDARLATSEKGAALIEQAVTGLRDLLDDMSRFDLSNLK